MLKVCNIIFGHLELMHHKELETKQMANFVTGTLEESSRCLHFNSKKRCL